MTFPKWMKPGAYGVLIGAFSVSILGFNWGGWTTAGNAQKMAENFAVDEVTLAMVPVCLNRSEADVERSAKLAILKDSAGYTRRKAMMDTGWATLPGTDAPNRDLADACLAGLELDES